MNNDKLVKMRDFPITSWKKRQRHENYCERQTKTAWILFKGLY